MKKSTLITTIAMIVVVVVALSTATYAWFAGSTVNQTEQTMTTSAGSGWYLYGGDITAPETTTDYQGSATITYSQTAPIALNLMNSGLFAPAATLANDLHMSSDLAGTFTDTQFFSAKQKGYGVTNSAEITTGVSYSHKISTTQDTASNLNAIRIFNGNENATSACHLTILVYTSATPSDREMLAGQGFTMYIATSKGDSFTTGYWYATALGSDGEAGAEAIKTASSSVAKSASGVTYKGNNDADTNAYKTIAANTEGKFGTKTLPAGTKYYTIDIVLDSALARDTALNIVFYAWFDGWALDSMAEGGTIGINLSFDGQETLVTTSSIGA